MTAPAPTLSALRKGDKATIFVGGAPRSVVTVVRDASRRTVRVEDAGGDAETFSVKTGKMLYGVSGRVLLVHRLGDEERILLHEEEDAARTETLRAAMQIDRTNSRLAKLREAAAEIQKLEVKLVELQGQQETHGQRITAARARLAELGTGR